MTSAPPRAARRRSRGGPAEVPVGPWVMGLETGGDELSVALWRLPADGGAPSVGWRLVDEVTAHRGHRHADAVLTLVDEALARQGIAPTDLALIAAARGPGGFTGVRVGLATAVGLSLGAGVPVWPVSSLAALAQHAAGRDAVIVPLIDARRGEVYGAAYRVARYGAYTTVLAPRVATCDAVLSAVAAAAHDTSAPRLVLGSGALKYGVASEVPPGWHRGNASHVAALAAAAWEAAGRDAAAAPPVDPTYIRKSDAEIAHDVRGVSSDGD